MIGRQLDLFGGPPKPPKKITIEEEPVVQVPEPEEENSDITEPATPETEASDPIFSDPVEVATVGPDAEAAASSYPFSEDRDGTAPAAENEELAPIDPPMDDYAGTDPDSIAEETAFSDPNPENEDETGPVAEDESASHFSYRNEEPVAEPVAEAEETETSLPFSDRQAEAEPVVETEEVEANLSFPVDDSIEDSAEGPSAADTFEQPLHVHVQMPSLRPVEGFFEAPEDTFEEEEMAAFEETETEEVPVEAILTEEIITLQPEVTSEGPLPDETEPAKEEKDESGAEHTLNIPADPALYSRQYYTMRETAAMFNVNQSLLRFWENEFDILKPKKNRKGDRYFRPEDIKNLELIFHLLKVRKFTIGGAKDYLKTRAKSLDTFEMVQRLEKLRLFLTELKSNN